MSSFTIAILCGLIAFLLFRLGEVDPRGGDRKFEVGMWIVVGSMNLASAVHQLIDYSMR